jgi:hypothetical protein
MKTIFTPQFVRKDQLYQPQLLVRALNLIADNKKDYAAYRELYPSERMTWLMTWLRKSFVA